MRTITVSIEVFEAIMMSLYWDDEDVGVLPLLV